MLQRHPLPAASHRTATTAQAAADRAMPIEPTAAMADAEKTPQQPKTAPLKHVIGEYAHLGGEAPEPPDYRRFALCTARGLVVETPGVPCIRAAFLISTSAPRDYLEEPRFLKRPWLVDNSFFKPRAPGRRHGRASIFILPLPRDSSIVSRAGLHRILIRIVNPI